ncbi:MAG: tripartite tricarboxylate transporter TctB family protein [Syntrophaceae bacterium]|nr:tripartite tricarboxylate transporter TctB family protein [Syntrophaceae bacterium]
MKIYEHWSSALWVLVGGAITVGAVFLGIGSFSKPGAGFAPLLAGLMIAVLAVIDLVYTLGSKRRVVVETPDRVAARKIIICIGALVVYSLLMPTLGFPLMTVILMAVLFRFTEAMSWKSSLFVAACVSAVAYLLFAQLLGADMPPGIFFD